MSSSFSASNFPNSPSPCYADHEEEALLHTDFLSDADFLPPPDPFSPTVFSTPSYTNYLDHRVSSPVSPCSSSTPPAQPPSDTFLNVSDAHLSTPSPNLVSSQIPVSIPSPNQVPLPVPLPVAVSTPIPAISPTPPVNASVPKTSNSNSNPTSVHNDNDNDNNSNSNNNNNNNDTSIIPHSVEQEIGTGTRAEIEIESKMNEIGMIDNNLAQNHIHFHRSKNRDNIHNFNFGNGIGLGLTLGMGMKRRRKRLIDEDNINDFSIALTSANHNHNCINTNSNNNNSTSELLLSPNALKEQRARRNRESAKRSRIKHKLYLNNLESKYYDIRNENNALKLVIEQLLSPLLEHFPALKLQLQALFQTSSPASTQPQFHQQLQQQL